MKLVISSVMRGIGEQPGAADAVEHEPAAGSESLDG